MDEYVPPVEDGPAVHVKAFPRECPRCGGWLRGGALSAPSTTNTWRFEEPPPGVLPGQPFADTGARVGTRLIGARCDECGAMVVIDSR